ncbi:MAG: shikimate dehydrogenase [Clostridiales Family XIII bacterium]|jgi:shikimate dehydrogenase|nr:shikimate dehydrogenase [Clostridiales Family XIII bacterium]
MNSVILIGMPASGKSTIGRRLAKACQYKFLDTDKLIEKQEGVSIKEIFEKRGEAAFRDMETQLLTALAEDPAAYTAGARHFILAVGGGTVERPENVALMKRLGTVVFLDRPPEDIKKYAKKGGKRPLLADGNKVDELYARRHDIYVKAADLTVKNGGYFPQVLTALSEMLDLSGITASYAVIGDPIAHSLSPALHNAVFETLGEPLRYSRIRVRPEKLAVSLKQLRDGTLAGLNVTIPHKIAIIPLLDEIRGDAQAAGAVNTVVREDGRLIGYNTDMEGLRVALAHHGSAYTQKNVTIIGTGGAAAGIASKAKETGASLIRIIGRNEARGSALADACGGTYVPWREGLAEDGAVMRDTHLLINATPLGMNGYPGQFTDFRFISGLPENAFVCDLVYSPPKTGLLAAAEARKLRFMNGLPMLLFQGILADELFLGRQLDRPALYEKAYAAVGKENKGKSKNDHRFHRRGARSAGRKP